MNNYSTINTNQLINILPNLYKIQLTNNIPIPAQMLWGAPGIGKSDCVKQIAAKTGELTGKTAVVTVASLLMMSPVDLRGIPTKAEDSGELVARWLKPQIFQMSASDDVINFLFLDEISAAPPAVQAAAYQIVLDRRVGEHEFPSNCIVIAAGNRVTDRAVAYKMPKPLSNRFTHYEVVVDSEAWIDWALTHDISQEIVGYIRFNPDHLNNFDPASDDVAFATPRSWALANQYLIAGREFAKAKNMNIVDAMFPQIAGTIGSAKALDFKAYVDTYAKLPKWEDIKSGKVKKVEIEGNELATLYALSSMLTVNTLKALENVNNIKDVDAFLTTIGAYVNTMPRKDLTVMVMRDVLRSCDAKARLSIVKNKEFSSVIRDIVDLIV